MCEKEKKDMKPTRPWERPILNFVIIDISDPTVKPGIKSLLLCGIGP